MTDASEMSGRPPRSRGIAKIAVRLRTAGYTIFYRFILGAGRSIDPTTVFEGPVLISSFAGHISTGARVRIGPYVRLDASRGGRIRIGASTSVNFGTHIVARELVEIGRNCLIGESCSIRDNDHGWTDPTRLIQEQGYSVKATRVGDDVWLGRGVAIMKGVTVEGGCVVAANAVVTKDLPSFCVAAGVPARIIKRRSPE